MAEVLDMDIGSKVKLMGEVISWSVKGKSIPVADIRNALLAQGFDEKALREMLPRNAFSRACNLLKENRVIRVKQETDTELVFQFTAEKKTINGDYVYQHELDLTLEKATGAIICTDPATKALAESLIAENMANRTAADITKLVQKLFEEEADMFPVRKAGGVYFVPERHRDFVARIAKLLEAVGGSISRFPVPEGTVEGTASVKQSVEDGIESLINSHLEAIEKLDMNSRQSTMEHRQQEIDMTKLKIEAYSLYLDEKRERLAELTAQAELRLKEKVKSLAEEKDKANNTIAQAV